MAISRLCARPELRLRWLAIAPASLQQALSSRSGAVSVMMLRPFAHLSCPFRRALCSLDLLGLGRSCHPTAAGADLFCDCSDGAARASAAGDIFDLLPSHNHSLAKVIKIDQYHHHHHPCHQHYPHYHYRHCRVIAMHPIR